MRPYYFVSLKQSSGDALRNYKKLSMAFSNVYSLFIYKYSQKRILCAIPRHNSCMRKSEDDNYFFMGKTTVYLAKRGTNIFFLLAKNFSKNLVNFLRYYFQTSSIFAPKCLEINLFLNIHFLTRSTNFKQRIVSDH